MTHEVLTLVFVQMDDHFGVRLSLELMSLGLQAVTQLSEVVDFTIEDEMNPVVFITHRLCTRHQIDHLQASHPKTDLRS